MLDVIDQVGFLLDAKHGVITGWVSEGKGASPTVEVELFAQAIPLGRCVASSAKPLQAPDKYGTQRFALHIERLPPELTPPYSIRAQLVETKAQLNGEIYIETRAQQSEALEAFAGTVTGLKDGAVEGWVLRKSDPGELVAVEMLLNGCIVSSSVADQIVPASTSFGSGHGFRLPLPAQVLDGAVHNLCIRITSNALTLDGSPVPVALLAIPMLLQRLDSVERTVADLRDRFNRDQAEFIDKAYQSIGVDLARRVDAVALLQRDAFERELAGLRSRLDVAPPRLTAPPRTESLSTKVVFDANLVGYDWYLPEMLPILGPFRWMGESATMIVDFSSRAPATLRIFVIYALDEIHLSSLSVTVNTTPVICTPQITDHGWILEGEVPVQAFLRAPYAAVTFKAKFARAPEGEDPRKLSIAIRAIELMARPG